MNRNIPTRRMNLAAATTLGAAMVLFSGGCATNDAQSGLMLGTALGAGVGAIVGHNTGRRTAEGAAIGAGVGALSGYVIGNESDKARASHYRHYNYRY